MSHNHTKSTDDVSRKRPDYFVLGGGTLGVAVASELKERGHAAAVVGETVDAPTVPSINAAPTDTAALQAAGLSGGATVIVATRSDRRNLLIAQLIRAGFDEPRVVVLANTDDRLGLFADAGHEAVCATSAISDAVADRV